jgi:uncharacterized protein (TIGR02246 family)
MRITRSTALAGLFALTFAACARVTEEPAAAAGEDPAAVRSAIETMNQNATAAMKAGDTVGMFANYADDAVIMMANYKAWRGRTEWSPGFGGLMSAFTVKDVSFTTTDVIVGGDLAVETGEYTMTLTPKAGGADMPDQGKYMTVWRKQADGSWKIVRDISNTSVPQQ